MLREHMRLHCYETSLQAWAIMNERRDRGGTESVFLLDPRKLDTFTAHMECLDFYDGVLLDNYLYETPAGGYAALYECYETSASSVYLVIMGTRFDSDIADEFNEWKNESLKDCFPYY